ncbi:MAG: CRISPR-associated helicase Cas3' [Promethearchaeota archaeon]
MNNQNYQILARPKQYLKTHLKNVKKLMLDLYISDNCEFNSFFPNQGINFNKKKFFSDIIEIIALCHDFGKYSPCFQKKLIKFQEGKYNSQLNNLFKTKCEEFENQRGFHVYTSTLMALLITVEFINSRFNLEIPEELLDENNHILNDIRQLIKIIYNVIMYHHSRYLKEKIVDLSSEFDNNILDELKFLFSREKSRIIDEWCSLFSVDLQKIVLNVINKLKKFFNDTQLFEDFLDDLDLNIFFKAKDDSSYFFLYLYLFSLLSSADEHDAGYHYNNVEYKHVFPLEFEPDKDINITLLDKYRNEMAKTSWKNLKSENIKKLRIKLNENVKKFEKTWLESKNSLESLPKIYTLTAPTGAGKTLALIELAFYFREYYQSKTHIFPRIIYCLPFVALADQIGEIIKKILNVKNINTNKLIIHHHLTELSFAEIKKVNDYQESIETYEYRQAKYYINTWNADIIISTMVKLWNVFFETKKTTLKRFNKLANSIIILDEIQTLPVSYWLLFAETLSILSRDYNCTIILSTATQPLIFKSYIELNDYLNNKIYPLEINQFDSKPLNINRYRVIYHSNPININDFKIRLTDFLKDTQENFMIVMNTKRSALEVYKFLKKELYKQDSENISFYFLSSYMIPSHRNKILEELKKNLNQVNSNYLNKKNYNKQLKKRVILVCTQVIEAGIDISFDQVIRDLAPFDSIIQVAGRCNRNDSKDSLGVVNVFEVLNEKNIPFYNLAYHDIVTKEITIEILRKGKVIDINGEKCYIFEEKSLQTLIKPFFTLIKERKMISDGLYALKKNKINELREKLKLIKTYEDSEILFIIGSEKLNGITLNNDVKQFLQELSNKNNNDNNTRKLNSNKIKLIPPSFFHYSISLLKSDFKQLVRKNIIYPIYLNQSKNTISKFYILDLKKHPYLYSEEFGLDILSLN